MINAEETSYFRTLFQDMDEYHHVDMGSKCLCCDICMRSCKYGSCAENYKSFVFM